MLILALLIMIKIILFFSSILFSDSEIVFGLIISEMTPTDISTLLISNINGICQEVSQFSNSTQNTEILFNSVSVKNSEYQIPEAFLNRNVQIILDASNDLDYSQFLSLECLRLGLLHIVLFRPFLSYAGEQSQVNTIYLDSSSLSEAQALVSLISFYNWHHIGLIHDDFSNNIQIAFTFKSLLPRNIFLLSELMINSAMPLENLSKLIGTTIKYSGARIVIVIATSKLASMVLSAADNQAMGGSGYVWIFNSQAMTNLAQISKYSNSDLHTDQLGIVKTGAVGILNEDAFLLEQDPLFDLVSQLTIVTKLFNTFKNSTDLYYTELNTTISYNFIQNLKFQQDGTKKNNFFLYNIQFFTNTECGYWENSLNKWVIDEKIQILWPGLQRTTPNEYLIPMNLVLLYPSMSEYIDIRNGFEMAISEVNNLLEGYYFNPVYLETGNKHGLVTGLMKSLESQDIIGYVGPLTSEMAEEYSAYINKSSIPKPLVSYGASSFILNSTVLYPYFLRTIQPDGLQASALAIYLQSLSLKKVAVIYTNDDVGLGIYQSFVSNSAVLEISVMNDPEFQAINSSLNPDGSVSDAAKTSIGAALNNIIRNQVKIIVFLGGTDLTAEIALQASALQLFGSDYFWIASMWLSNSTLQDLKSSPIYSKSLDQIFNVLEGSMCLGFKPPSGQTGIAFAENYLKKYEVPYTTYSMLTYDTVYLFYNSIQKMILQEEDFTNGPLLMGFLRNSDFTVASGSMKFSEGTNDRSAIGYSLFNVQNRSLIEINQYDPLNNYFSKPFQNIVWGGESPVQTNDSWGSTFDCPFPEILSVSDLNGVSIIMGIGIGLFLLTLGLSIFSHFCLKQEIVAEINTAVTKTWKDTLVQIQIGIEFFQFIAIAPYFNSLQKVIQVVSNVFMLDIMKISGTDKQYYWVALSGVCTLCYIWFFLMVMVIFKGENWVNKVPFFRKIVSLMNSVFLPFLGNTMFLPVLAFLLDAFVCDHKELNKPYVWRDCFMNCWQGDHIYYIILASFAIFLYEPLAVLARPMWQKAKGGIQLKIKPFFLMLKTCVQILLISVAKVLQGNSPIAHGIVFSSLLLMFAIVTYKFKAFNYYRCDLWEITSLIAVAYLAILATISNILDSSSIGWFIGLVFGWLLIACGAFFVQHKYFPALLISQKKNSFTRKVQSVYSVEHVGTLSKKSIEKIENALHRYDNSDAVIDLSVSRIEDNPGNNSESGNSNSSSEENQAIPI